MWPKKTGSVHNKTETLDATWTHAFQVGRKIHRSNRQESRQNSSLDRIGHKMPCTCRSSDGLISTLCVVQLQLAEMALPHTDSSCIKSSDFHCRPRGDLDRHKTHSGTTPDRSDGSPIPFQFEFKAIPDRALFDPSRAPIPPPDRARSGPNPE